VLGELGAGGMGEVYRACDERLGRDVALKVLPAEVAADPDRRRRFEREARAVAALNHPGVVVLHDVGEAGGVAFLVTELLEGETLRERLRRAAAPCEKVAEWGASTAEALAAAHARGIVHRDVKPENLFLTRDGRLKVLDFGLARELPLGTGPGEDDPTLPSPTRAGLVLGTLGYLSPEQARGEAVDGRSDIFSLGCVLHEALTGRRAFAGSTAQDLIAAVLRDEPPDVASTRPDAPAALARVVERCLGKARAERFQSASESDRSGGALNLWWRPLSGGGERRLTRGLGDYFGPRISRDGRRLVCEARTSTGSLRALDLGAKAAGLGDAITAAGAEDASPSTSRSGRIAFSSVRKGRATSG
jgi:serine/threonine protein kinase